ncbi:hypothetical protein QQX09_04885 [Demequina sp. SYSU T00192]|uniref:Uncharacterized protein n=1 Tax=Demequina litoralis TaxID=3051660 RepID=A0ABT8G7T2_9MICO|nr:hypothetical protein [Demequina sp. SYSU T00192]MDN4475193.1 hypothetical protein [Demequina sp. SYSU T00192]
MDDVTEYSGDYIDACRWRIEAEVAAFDLLRQQAPGDGTMDAPIQNIADEYFVAVASQLEGMFANRSRAAEGSRPGPLHEMRAVVESLNGNGGRFAPPEGSGLDAGTTVLRLDPGEPIMLDREAFQLLSDAFFDSLEETYGETS